VLETGIISCQKNISLACSTDFEISLFDNLSIFDKTIVTGSSNDNIYLYISISDSCAHNLESISIITFLIDSFLSSKYQEINQSNSSLKFFHIFANQYQGKSVK